MDKINELEKRLALVEKAVRTMSELITEMAETVKWVEAHRGDIELAASDARYAQQKRYDD